MYKTIVVRVQKDFFVISIVAQFTAQLCIFAKISASMY